MYGSKLEFDSWLDLCEESIEAAIEHYRRLMMPQIEALADEMIATAKEI